MASLTIGLMADTSIQLSNLRSIVTSANFLVGSELLTRQEDLRHLPAVDLWVVRVDMEDERSQAIIEQLDGLDIPVIYDEADSYSSLNIEERARRFSRKIESCGLVPQSHNTGLVRAKYVWVLAASAGGPEAVVKFIEHVSDDINDVAFIYAQHMDDHTSEALVRGLQRHCPWKVHYCTESNIIYEKSIHLVSPKHQIEIDDFGALNPSKLPWVGYYKPSVDQVVAKVWRKYGKYGGVIVFSGMGDDGAKNCRMIKNAGGQVWAQSPESCAIDSMPREVMKTNCVNYQGTPEQLAKHFTYYQNLLSSEQRKQEQRTHDQLTQERIRQQQLKQE